jgi:hypothetical protein
MLHLRRAYLALVALAVFSLWLRAEGPPKGEEILDKYVEATGGKAAYEKCTNRVVHATIEVLGVGIKGKVTTYSAAPAKVYTETNLPGLGKFEEGTDGKVAWDLNATTGPRLKEGSEKTNALRRADFYGELNWRKHFKKVVGVGEETVDGKPCYKVELTTPDDQIKTRYYDKATSLLVKSTGVEKTAMGEFKVEALMSDYRNVDGVKIPFKSRQKFLSNEMIVTMDKVEHNVKLPENRFDLPEEIKKLTK